MLGSRRFGEEEPPEPAAVPDPDLQARLDESCPDLWHSSYLGWLALHRWSAAAVPILADARGLRGRAAAP
ncbi:hypothetical protein [Streptacidiphilus neutrinimicus]|uniref:hypothetical protein n=1 Tax=Streptacidiphilus neutrinimicus TaxID=105420 RepID=UPI0005A7060C|nr:hypothetical protein [Streptacidiphilus neutrinimicus]